jgi:ATP-binding protein involved in chromosome partitioning
LFAIDLDNQQILESETLTPPPHEPGLFPKWLGEMGVDLVLAGGLGPKAQTLLSEQGIEAIAGCPALEPKLVVQQYLTNSLSTGNNTCDH